MSAHRTTHDNEASRTAPRRADTRRLRALASGLIVLAMGPVATRPWLNLTCSSIC